MQTRKISRTLSFTLILRARSEMAECNFYDTNVIVNILDKNTTKQDILDFLNTLLERYKEYFECTKREDIQNLIKEAEDIQNELELKFDFGHILLCFINKDTINNKKSITSPLDKMIWRSH